MQHIINSVYLKFLYTDITWNIKKIHQMTLSASAWTERVNGQS